MQSPLVLHIGFGHFIMLSQLVSFHPVESAPIKKLILKMRENDKLFDATNGKKQKTVFFMTTGQLVLSAIEAKTLRERLDKGSKK